MERSRMKDKQPLTHRLFRYVLYQEQEGSVCADIVTQDGKFVTYDVFGGKRRIVAKRLKAKGFQVDYA